MLEFDDSFYYVSNARSYLGEKVDFSFKLPLNDLTSKIPNNVASISVFENINNVNKKVFNIFVGETCKFKDLAGLSFNYIEYCDLFDLVTSVDDRLVYYINQDNKLVFYAVCGENDIIVHSLGELNLVLSILSKEFKTINDSIGRIKLLNRK